MKLASSPAPQVQPLWEPTVLLPSQYLDRSTSQSPEVALMSAVLQDAFLCVARNLGAEDRRRRRELREAHEWFSSPNRDWPFAFLQVCDTLGLDTDAIRQRVAALVTDHGAEAMLRHARKDHRTRRGARKAPESDRVEDPEIQ